MRSLSIPKLSGNMLKLLASAVMFIDHMGMLLFPRIILFRIIGRLAFPIFAFFIAEGCRHTKNKLRHFLTIASAGILFQLVYYLFSKSLYMNIFITFALSMTVLFPMQYLKKVIFSETRNAERIILALILFTGAVAFVYVINQVFTVDYGFGGCMLPVFAGLFMMPRECSNAVKRFDNNLFHVIVTGIALVCLSYDLGGNQIYSLLSLPLLLMYSGERGKLSMKYFFYIFYPVHLVVLQAIKFIIK